MNGDRCRFCKLYAISLAVLAPVVGAVLTVQFHLELRNFAGLEYVWRLVFVSTLRSTGPAVSGSALLLALLLWAHRLSPTALEEQLPSVLKRGLIISLPGFAAAVLLICGASVAVGVALFRVPVGELLPAAHLLKKSDFATGVVGTLADALVIGLLAWRGLSRLQKMALSLPAKIAIAWAVSFLLRALVGLLLPVIR